MPPRPLNAATEPDSTGPGNLRWAFICLSAATLLLLLCAMTFASLVPAGLATITYAGTHLIRDAITINSGVRTTQGAVVSSTRINVVIAVAAGLILGEFATAGNDAAEGWLQLLLVLVGIGFAAFGVIDSAINIVVLIGLHTRFPAWRFTFTEIVTAAAAVPICLAVFLVFSVSSGGGLSAPTGFILLVALVRIAGTPVAQRHLLTDTRPRVQLTP